MLQFLMLEEFHALSPAAKKNYVDVLTQELLKRRTELDELEGRSGRELAFGARRPD